MLDKGKIIQSAFLKMGNTTSYNDNTSDEWKVTNILLEEVIGEIAINEWYMFNAITVKLNRVREDKNEQGEYQFYKPVDFLNLIACKDGRLEGNYFYGKPDELFCQFCADIPFTKYPEYLFNIIVYALCVKLGTTYSQYKNKMEFFMQLYAEERNQIIANESSNVLIYKETRG